MPDTLNSKILIVEDDPSVLASLRRRLAFEGYRVDTAVTGLMALEMFRPGETQLVILDVMLPELPGFEVAQRLRAQSEVPILFLTARASVEDRVAGLEHGADDYLVKPFAFEELLARVKALLRRIRSQGGESAAELSLAHLRLNLASREVFCGQRRLPLTAREFDLLAYFLRNARIVLSREKIFEAVWGHDAEGASNVIDVHVRALREKMEQDAPRLLQTVRGVGYVLREDA